MMQGIDDLLDFFRTGNIIEMFCRSKFNVKFISTHKRIKYVQAEYDIVLFANNKTFKWIPIERSDKYLSPLPLEYILEVEIKQCFYNHQEQTLKITFSNESYLILMDPNYEGVLPWYKDNDNDVNLI